MPWIPRVSTRCSPSGGRWLHRQCLPASKRSSREPYISYGRGGVRRSVSWEPQYPLHDSPALESIDAAADRVRSALQDATALRMLRSDVPVGSYLSGGLDSSLIATMGLVAKGTRFSTFSLRFEASEYDETHYQRLLARHIGSDHHELLVTPDQIAAVFPQVILHTERPVLRTAPAPMFLLSKLVHDRGIKVVLTGEGADEMFAGYDLFREARVRRFWARRPQSTMRPRLLERLYPYLARSPVSAQAITRQFFGRDLDRSLEPGFGHGPRWQSTRSVQRLFSGEFRDRVAKREAVAEFVGSLPRDFARWTPLAQDQFIEVRTLLSGYLLSSQGDRMLMANSVEGRFPFLDRSVAALAESLPASHKLRVLDEKHVLKKAGVGLIPAEILNRPKQPYRAPDAMSFRSNAAREWIAEVASEKAVADAGVFEPASVQALLHKCMAPGFAGQFSNADNMSVVGVLSTQLVHHHFVRQRPSAPSPKYFRTVVDRQTTAESPA